MKPLQLKIKGLNSFLEEQLIDFTQLSECGLFGIFGPTGSGKSSILDAITLALYGKVPRAGGQLNGIINSQTDTVQVAYDFALGSEKERKIYRVQRSFKRNKNSSGEGVSTKQASVYDLSNADEPQVLFEGTREVNAGVVSLIGLNAEDFTRSVVLPQGSFSDFLKMTGADRALMLERIFALEAYGERMNSRIKQYKAQKYLQRMQLDSLLTAYADSHPESYAALETEIAAARSSLEEQSHTYQNVDDDYHKFKEIWSWQEELKGYQQTARELENLRTQMQAAQETLQKAEKAAQLKPLLEKVSQREQLLQEKKAVLAALLEKQALQAEEAAQIQQNWEKARQEKDYDLPLCLEQMHQLESAVKIESQIKQLELEHKNLQEQYRLARDAAEQKRSALEQIQVQLDQINLQLSKAQENLELLKITPQLREKINAAYEQEKQYQQAQNQVEEKQQALGKLEKSLQEIDNRLHELLSKSEKAETAMQTLLQESQSFLSHCPGQKEDLLALQAEINSLQNETEHLEALLQEENNANLELAKIAAERESCSCQWAAARESIDKHQLLLQTQQRQIEKTRDQHMAFFLAEKLSDGQACPVCGSLHHPNPAILSESMEISELDDAKTKLEQQVKELQDQARQIEQQYQTLLNRQEFMEQAAQLRRDKIAGRQLTEQQAILSQKEVAFRQLNEAMQSWEEAVKANDVLVNQNKDELAQISQQLAVQQSTWQKENELLRKTTEEILDSRTCLQTAQQNYQTSRQELGLERMEERVRQMQKDDRLLAELEKKSKTLITEREDLEQTKILLQAEINKFDLAKTEIEISGREKKQVLAEKRGELQAICGDQKPELALPELNRQIIEIENNYQKIQRAYESARQLQEKVKQDYSNLDGDVNALQSVLSEEIQELNAALLMATFQERQEILEYYLEDRLLIERREEITLYQEKCKLNQANVDRINEKLQGQGINAADWEQLQQKRIGLQKLLEELKKQLVLQEAAQAEMQVKLQARQALLEKKQGLDQEYGYIEDLEGLFKGRKFVDFIARTQLRYIATEASRNLKDITRGRYALEINAEGDFVIRDDYNGGVRRATHTLSGGETFLCSLALALALSSHIQLGRASLEFFFLDEGFGSLDPETLETVIDALENLHSEQLTVGLISHVEELKQRVPRKLIVRQAVHGISGSTVKIE